MDPGAREHLFQAAELSIRAPDADSEAVFAGSREGRRLEYR